MKALIEADMKAVDVATADGLTALHVAAKRGNVEAVNLLVKRDANTNCKRLLSRKLCRVLNYDVLIRIISV